jgi:iron-sulfur cluster assembly protein
MTNSFQLTDKACTAINLASAKDTDVIYLRVGVKGGKCSGLSYYFQFEIDHKDTDLIFQQNNAIVIIDPKSMVLLNSATLDYHKSLMKSEFRVVQNPQQKSSCGCGKSFTIG